jgi:hypothetical protein
VKPSFVRSSAALDAQTLKLLVDAFTDSMGKAVTPLREQLAAIHDTLRGFVASFGTAAGAAAVPGRPRAAAAAVDVAPRRAAVTAPREDEPACLVPDCTAPVLAKQLCETHYRIMRRASAAGEEFDPASQRPARARTVSKRCREAGCTDAHYAKGLCRRHYMAARSRIRAAERHGLPAEADIHDDAPEPEPEEAREPEAAAPSFTLRSNGGLDRGLVTPLFEEPAPRTAPARQSLPTAEVVARVVVQHRGGLDRVAEVLGRNKRTLMELLGQLDLIPFVTRVREEQRQRIVSASLPERLDDLLFREKLLEDLGCLKEVDDRTRLEIRMRYTQLAKDSETIEQVLQKLGRELQLDDNGMKRLIWRYDLRRQLRGLKLKPASAPARTRV